LILGLTACGQKGTGETDTDTPTSSGQAVSESTVSNTLAEDEEGLISTYADKFSQETYSDSETGLEITYNYYLPEDYDESKSYPMVVFIADSSCTGDDATRSLTQGRGALVWATKEWQAANPTIVAVPTYPETILDDHGSYTQTDYVDMTKSYIDYMTETYAVDKDRIYGTGQSMGCMTTLILASQYPNLYAACMFVDGQWDVSTLKGLEDQTFVYFAAEDDTNAWNGAQEVMAMFDEDDTSYKRAQWDGNWSVDELSAGATELFDQEDNQYFISWATGTIDASNSSMGAGGPGGTGGTSDGEKPSGDFGGPSNGEKPSGGFGGPASGGAASGDMNSSAYHMASFDYAYNCVAVMEWLFLQKK
nr:prolyl oligopeptidase family serine peptidase [Eubacterium sp.]